MPARRRLKNDPASRLVRQAVALDRLAAKAWRAGQWAAYDRYAKRSHDLKLRADSMRARAEERRAR